MKPFHCSLFCMNYFVGFCQNLFDRGVLRWDDFSLVIVDEAHHCEKAHPFNVMLSSCRSASRISDTITSPPPGIIAEPYRPHIVGLTASPAGKPTVQLTVGMLNTLISNMGEARMCIVEEADCISTLESFQSSAQLEARTPMDSSESYAFENTFKSELNAYIVDCFLKLLQTSDIRNYVDVRKEMKPGISDNVVRMIADGFVENQLDAIQCCLSSVRPLQKGDEVNFGMLIRHIEGVCMARSSLYDGGVFCAIQDLKELQDAGLDFARSQGLKTAALSQLIHIDASSFAQGESDDPAAPADNHVQNLIRELTSIQRSGRDDQPTISLVLVKQRATAFHLTKILQVSCFKAPFLHYLSAFLH